MDNPENDSKTDRVRPKKEELFQFIRSSTDNTVYYAIGNPSNPSYTQALTETIKAILNEKKFSS